MVAVVTNSRSATGAQASGCPSKLDVRVPWAWTDLEDLLQEGGRLAPVGAASWRMPRGRLAFEP
jgi:hypothetical protein